MKARKVDPQVLSALNSHIGELQQFIEEADPIKAALRSLVNTPGAGGMMLDEPNADFTGFLRRATQLTGEHYSYPVSNLIEEVPSSRVMQQAQGMLHYLGAVQKRVEERKQVIEGLKAALPFAENPRAELKKYFELDEHTFAITGDEEDGWDEVVKLGLVPKVSSVSKVSIASHPRGGLRRKGTNRQPLGRKRGSRKEEATSSVQGESKQSSFRLDENERIYYGRKDLTDDVGRKRVIGVLARILIRYKGHMTLRQLQEELRQSRGAGEVPAKRIVQRRLRALNGVLKKLGIYAGQAFYLRSNRVFATADLGFSAGNDKSRT